MSWNALPRCHPRAVGSCLRIGRSAEFVVVGITQNATGTTVESVLAHVEGR
jgi:hypothetical protein